MEISLLVIGKTNTDYIKMGLDEYLKRLRHYTPYKIEYLSDIKNGGKMSENQQKEAEGKSILSSISNSDFVVLLDEHGQDYTSIKFAQYLQKKQVSGLRRLVFIIGGPYGFSDDVYKRSNEKISLSKMTFNHEMIRLFFTEQVYRAMTILRGEPYHHE